MITEFLRGSLVAITASVAVLAVAGTASANGSSGGKHVLVTCPAGQDSNGNTFHLTKIQIRNITSVNHAFIVKSVKFYGPTGALLTNSPTPDAFPVGFTPDVPAHAGAVLSTDSFFGTTSPSLLTAVLDIEVKTSTIPFLILSVQLSLDPDHSLTSLDVSPCVSQW